MTLHKHAAFDAVMEQRQTKEKARTSPSQQVLKKNNSDLSVNPPREDSQHQVEDKERSDDDEGDEVEPVPVGAQGIVGLKHQNKL